MIPQMVFARSLDLKHVVDAIDSRLLLNATIDWADGKLARLL